MVSRVGLGAILVDLVRVAGRVVLVRSGVEEAGPKVGGGGGVGCDVQGRAVRCCCCGFACLSFPAEMGEVAAVMYDGMRRGLDHLGRVV